MKIHPFEIQLQISSGQTGTATTMVSSHEVKRVPNLNGFLFTFSGAGHLVQSCQPSGKEKVVESFGWKAPEILDRVEEPPD